MWFTHYRSIFTIITSYLTLHENKSFMYSDLAIMHVMHAFKHYYIFFLQWLQIRRIKKWKVFDEILSREIRCYNMFVCSTFKHKSVALVVVRCWWINNKQGLLTISHRQWSQQKLFITEKQIWINECLCFFTLVKTNK